MKLLEKPSVLLLVGKPGKGKSNAIKWFILKHTLNDKLYKFGIVFTRTKFNEDYNYIDQNFVYDNYSGDVLKSYLDKLQQQKMQKQEIPRNFVIFDDLIGLLSKSDPFLTNFFGTHRHTNTDIYLATQHLKTGASTTLREITTYAVLFGSRQKNTIEALFENFGQLFDDIQSFKEHYFNVTSEPFTAMLYDNRNEDIDSNYLSFKAPDMSKNKIVLDFGQHAEKVKPTEQETAVETMSGLADTPVHIWQHFTKLFDGHAPA